MPTDETYLAGVRKKYNGTAEIWDASDLWHAWSRRQIRTELDIVKNEFAGSGEVRSSTVVDIGSAGYDYFGPGTDRIDVDVAEKTLRGRAKGVCCSAERLALASNIADLIVCVGPVLNYCSLEESLSEFARVTAPGARLVLHLELSNSWEFFGTSAWRKSVAFVKSFYQGEVSYWVYSDNFTKRILRINGFKIQRVRYFHYLSSLAYRITGAADLSSRLGHFDPFLSRLPWAGALADSAIYVCRREA